MTQYNIVVNEDRGWWWASCSNHKGSPGTACRGGWSRAEAVSRLLDHPWLIEAEDERYPPFATPAPEPNPSRPAPVDQWAADTRKHLNKHGDWVDFALKNTALVFIDAISGLRRRVADLEAERGIR